MGIIDNYGGFKSAGHGDIFFISTIKKIVLIFLFILLGTGQAYSAAGVIEVTQPADQDSFIQDQTMTINWSSQGQPVLYVAIQLVDASGSNVVKSITGKTMNDGIYEWKIPLDLAPANYRIKVSSKQVNADDVSGLFEVKQKITWHAPGYAMLTSIKVNDESPSDSCTDPTKRVSFSLQDGIQIQATASSVILPILYKYKVELTDPYTGYDYAIYDGTWVKQSALNLNPTGDEIIHKVFPNGVTGSQMPISLAGCVTVEAKNMAQSEPPQKKEICISIWGY